MIELEAHQVARLFGAEVLFENVSIQVKTGERVALIGRNGTGKSTLLKMLAQLEAPDEGSVHLAKGKTIGYLDQYSLPDQDKTVYQTMQAIFKEEYALLKQLETITEQMSQPDVMNDPKQSADLLQQFDRLQMTVEEKGAYQIESDIKMVLSAFQFPPSFYGQPVHTLSGGQQTRLALAKLLLEAPDILILDEPTNHLDIDTLNWLESYLISRKLTLLFVSHDQYFLDKITTRLYELSPNHIEEYHGNYSYYLKERESRYQLQLKRYNEQQSEIKRLEDYVQRNLARASTTKQAQSRRKKLERMERIERPKDDQRAMRLVFNIQRESGKDVLQLDRLSIGYDQPLADQINLLLKRQQAIAIVGANGVGKTTLLKTIMKEIDPLGGTITLGSHVDLGYYHQQVDHLNPKNTILNELWNDHFLLPEQTIRTLLGSFLFSGDDVKKSIGQLSGGEKARVSLAKLSLEQHNTLLMDEPTNHLDLDSKEVLEDALENFEGTLLFVSHDRYFINQIATAILEIENDTSTLYLGDYDYYLEKKEEMLAIQEATAQLEQPNRLEQAPIEEPMKEAKAHYTNQKERQKEWRQLSRQIERAETTIDTLEQRIDAIHTEMTQPDVLQSLEKMEPLQKELETLQAQLEEVNDEWADLAMEMERFEA
ncbi:ABC-F family ATP-binding cassette domain-containing protein [Atopobacter phocae]|uniref:ABC-F family ATP-binding cassette domain-containing protein n=1 Tax=Atopobacter phocae TaxID=136492 RepID=UPI00046ECC6E|nr:ABC-F family ATP-binding cassette domain-containing protein [Atopobacter phocae]